ncbi:MAG: hypothetical protein WC631_02325 [Candidatus Paceibacterota bacterium]|jgi:hypothetical protein
MNLEKLNINSGQQNPVETPITGLSNNVENTKEAMSAVIASNNFNELLLSLSLLKSESEVGSESYKDSVYCAALIDLIKKGHWQDKLNLQYIDDEKIRIKIEELQFEYRISLANSIDDLKSIITEVDEINKHNTKDMCKHMDEAISLNGTRFLKEALKMITNKFGLRDRVKEILEKMPKSELKPEEEIPPDGPLIPEDGIEIIGHTPIESHTSDTVTKEVKEVKPIKSDSGKSRWRKLLGI